MLSWTVLGTGHGEKHLWPLRDLSQGWGTELTYMRKPMIPFLRVVQGEVLGGSWGCLDKGILHEMLTDVSASPTLPCSQCPVFQVLAPVLVVVIWVLF